MVCKNCGKSLGNEKATCPFCGALMDQNQLEAFVKEKKEREQDLRPKLVSERYGMALHYEKQKNQTNHSLFIILGILLVLVILFLIAVFILF